MGKAKKIKPCWILFFFIAIGCGSARITNSWKAPNLQPKPYNKIVVLALLNDPDRTVRQKIEQHMAGDLTEMGYNAVCSCQEFDPKDFDNMDENQALEKLTSSGIDAVLIAVLLDKSQERFHVPENNQYSPYGIYQNNYHEYYRTMYDLVYAPGYYVTTTKYIWESNFYALDTKALLYSAQSQSFNPESDYYLGHTYGKMIVKDMVKQNVLINQKAK